MTHTISMENFFCHLYYLEVENKQERVMKWEWREPNEAEFLFYLEIDKTHIPVWWSVGFAEYSGVVAAYDVETLFRELNVPHSVREFAREFSDFVHSTCTLQAL